jgi:DNA-binding transcriptional ArsR family regulator
MNHITDRMKALALEFRACGKAFCALGDETRQEIIMALAEKGCEGMRVGDITGRTSLSRPAVSHHLRILKDSGIIGMRSEGTMNYYYLDPEGSQWGRMTRLMSEVDRLVKDAAPAQGKRERGEEADR